MTYRQVRDVMLRLRTAHRNLRDAIEQPWADDPRTQLVLDRLRAHEQRFQRALAVHESQDGDAVMNTWLQYIPDEDVFEAVSSITFSAGMSPDEVIARKFEFDRALQALLGQLAEGSAAPRVQEFFRSLLKYVEAESAQESWSVREFQPGEHPPPLKT